MYFISHWKKQLDAICIIKYLSLPTDKLNQSLKIWITSDLRTWMFFLEIIDKTYGTEMILEDFEIIVLGNCIA